jgi:hypothetical protein
VVTFRLVNRWAGVSKKRQISQAIVIIPDDRRFVHLMSSQTEPPARKLKASAKGLWPRLCADLWRVVHEITPGTHQLYRFYRGAQKPL